MYLRLTLNPAGLNEPKGVDKVECLVNMDTVVTVSPDPNNDEHSKIKCLDGTTYRVMHTVTKIEAMLEGNLTKGYVAPEPKDP